MSSITPPPIRQRAESFSDVSTSEDVAKILYVFQAMSPEAIVARLSMRLVPEAASNPSSISLLLMALKANGFESELVKAEGAIQDTEERHCARCHTSYLEKNNARNACVIRHAYPLVGSTGRVAGAAMHQTKVEACSSCRSSLPSASSCVMSPTCFVGRHTTNNNAAYREKSPLVKTCEELKCKEGHLAVNGRLTLSLTEAAQVKSDVKKTSTLFDFGVSQMTTSSTTTVNSKSVRVTPIQFLGSTIQPATVEEPASSSKVSTPNTESTSSSQSSPQVAAASTTAKTTSTSEVTGTFGNTSFASLGKSSVSAFGLPKEGETPSQPFLLNTFGTPVSSTKNRR